MMPQDYTAVLARVVRIEPQSDGSGKTRYRGPLHLFNGDDFWNHAGRIRAWCGARLATVDLEHVEDRDHPQLLAAALCGRCFLQPRKEAP